MKSSANGLILRIYLVTVFIFNDFKMFINYFNELIKIKYKISH